MLESAATFRIEPGLGIARVGSSSGEFFIGPEFPGQVPNEGQPYKDRAGKLKRQAARFRVYAYDPQGNPLGEVTAAQAHIEWRVHPANRKAAWYQFINAMDLGDKALPAPRRNAGIVGSDRRSLVIDPGAKRISGANQSGTAFQFEGSFMGRRVLLGEIRTDDAGRLLVLGGLGRSESVSGSNPTTFANNDGWFDDTSDGTVRATVSFGGRSVEAEPAMFAAVPPNYAPGLTGPVTMFDVVTDLFAREFGWPKPAQPEFHRDIYPIFRRLSELESVNHGMFMLFGWGSHLDFREPTLARRLADASESARPFRQRLFAWFRDPGANVVALEKLPPFYGDTFGEFAEYPLVSLHVTGLQFMLLRQWAEGDFTVATASATPTSLDILPAEEQAAALNKAALEECLGGPFHPGIELTWTMRLKSLWAAPFRLRIAPEGTEPPMDFGTELTSERALAADGPLQACYPGTLTWWMGIPWQTDEASCDAGYTQGTFLELPSFWAARVPNHVLDARSFSQLSQASLPLPQRLKHLAWRQRWLRFFREPYLQHIEDMVKQWDQVGVVVPKTLTGDDAGSDLPERTGVETEVDAGFTMEDPSWQQQAMADSAGEPAPEAPVPFRAAGPVPARSKRVTHHRGERG
jgi:hypothetical protein